MAIALVCRNNSFECLLFEILDTHLCAAGSLSATLHLLNQESRRYFNRMIAMSATGQADYGYIDGDHRCIMSIMAKRYNASTGESLDDLIQFIKHATKEQILEFQDIAANSIETTLRGINTVIIESIHFCYFPLVIVSILKNLFGFLSR